MLTLPFDESVVMPESQMCRKFSRECEDQKQIKKPESFSKQIVLRGKSPLWAAPPWLRPKAWPAPWGAGEGL